MARAIVAGWVDPRATAPGVSRTREQLLRIQPETRGLDADGTSRLLIFGLSLLLALLADIGSAVWRDRSEEAKQRALVAQ